MTFHRPSSAHSGARTQPTAHVPLSLSTGSTAGPTSARPTTGFSTDVGAGSAAEATARPHSPHGFTLIELLVTVAISAVLATVAYPAFSAQVDKARRADAVAALTAAQMAQERFRANQPLFGTLTELQIGSVSPAGHYALQVTANSASAYRILASAQGVQSRDAACRHLQLGMTGGNADYASGPDAAVANAAAVNQKCWGL